MKAFIEKSITRYTRGDGSLYVGQNTFYSIYDGKSFKTISGIDKKNLWTIKKSLRSLGYTDFGVKTYTKTINQSQ